MPGEKLRNTIVAIAAAACLAAVIPLLSQTVPAEPKPPYDLDEAVRMVIEQTGGKVLRADAIPADQLVTGRGVAPADESSEDEDCPCENSGQAGDDDNGVRSRGVAPAEQPPLIYQIRVLSPGGEVRTVWVNEMTGLVRQDMGGTDEAADR